MCLKPGKRYVAVYHWVTRPHCFHRMRFAFDLLKAPAGHTAHPVSPSKGQSEEEEAAGEEGEQDPQGRAGQRHLLSPPVRQPVGGGRGQGESWDRQLLVCRVQVMLQCRGVLLPTLCFYVQRVVVADKSLFYK